MEMKQFQGTKDAFLILDSNKKIHRLKEAQTIVQGDGGSGFEN